MKKLNKLVSSILLLLSLMCWVACQDDTHNKGEGCLSMELNIAKPRANTPIEQTEPSASDNQLADSCRIRIYGSQGLVRFYKGLNSLPSELWLAAGDYRITALTGDSLPVAFNRGYYKGETQITIEPGNTTQATLSCRVVNTLVTVALSEQLQSILSDYRITVSSSQGSLVFTQQHTDSIGYFILPEGETTLNWHIEGSQQDGTNYTQSGTLSNVKAAMRYDITFNYNETEYTSGGAYFNLIVNETTIDKVENIVIYKRPDIIGLDFDIEQPLVFEANSGNETSVCINASSAISQLIIKGEQLTAMGLPANSIDLAGADAATLAAWESAGLSYLYQYDNENDLSSAKVTLSKSLISNLAEGVYEVEFHVTDMHAKQWSQTLLLTISNAVVLTEEVRRCDVWAKRATLRGKLMKDTSDALTFQYRVKGSDTWNSVDAQLDGTELSAAVGSLTSGTTYEYRAVAGTMASAIVAEFTTESEFIIPNAGFENWHKDGKVWLVYGSGESMWWDTGNHGSATLNVNITVQDNNLKHSGNSSVRMQSQFVSLLGIGKFAAGNIFSGVYSGTDGTNGILDFGRPISSRPSQLKGYYKYVTGTVDYSETDLLPKGATDLGNIYIAIGDWDAPIHITTKDHNVFDKDDAHIIGFGEIIPDKNTEGDGLIPFTIDIEYRSTERIPTYIVIVGSASYYGDFFTGSSSSTLWLDDLELVYE